MMKTMIVAIVLSLFSTAQAMAHAHLVEAVPSVGGVVEQATDIRLTFSEAVEAKFSTIKISSAAGLPLSAPAATIDPQDGHILRLVLPVPLAPGAYTLSWSVVSVDTHRSSGHFGFTVRP